MKKVMLLADGEPAGPWQVRVFPHFGPTVEGLLASPVQVLHPEWAADFVGADGRTVPAGQREFENHENWPPASHRGRRRRRCPGRADYLSSGRSSGVALATLCAAWRP